MSKSEQLIVGSIYHYAFIKSARVTDNMPRAFRQARKPDGTIVMQGGYFWIEGFSCSGIEWRDLPIIDVDESGNEIKKGGAE